MFSYARTFSRDLPRFGNALKFHSTMEDAMVKYHGGKKGSQRAAKDELPFIQIWDALMGFDADLDEDERPMLADCVEWTCPAEYYPVMRDFDGIAGAYAFCRIAERLASVDITDDMMVRDAMKLAWNDFEQRCLVAGNVEHGMGCDRSEAWITLRDIDKMPDSETFKKKIDDIAKLAGRMFDAMGYSKRPVPTKDPMEVDSTTVGGDVRRMLPAELGKLGLEETADLQAMKALRKQALQFDMKGVTHKARGPMVLVIDESGSMEDGHHYHGGPGRNTWAKAVMVALTRIAWAENRLVRVCHFSTSMVRHELPKGDQRALWEASRSFIDGGTNISAALDVGREMVGDLKAEGYDGADIVLVTDGCDWDHEGHEKRMDELDADGVRLWSVGIGADFNKEHPLRKRAEKYVFAHDSELHDEQATDKLVKGFEEAAYANTAINALPPKGGTLN